MNLKTLEYKNYKKKNTKVRTSKIPSATPKRAGHLTLWHTSLNDRGVQHGQKGMK